MISPIRLFVLFVVLFGLTACGGRVSISAEEKTWAFFIFWAVFTLYLCVKMGRYWGQAKAQKAHIKDLQKGGLGFARAAEPLRTFLGETDAFASMSDDCLAAELYETYCVGVGGKNFNGDKLPKWDEFRVDTTKQTQASAWVLAAAQAKKILS